MSSDPQQLISGPDVRALADPNPIVPSLRELIQLEGRAGRIKSAPRSAQSVESGRTLSKIKGRGMEYDESRPYAPGDDVRALDWRVTARTGRPHTKLYRDERDRPVILSVDYRGSMWFGTRAMFKSALAARLAALFAWHAHAHGDRVGYQVFSERGLCESPPESGRAAVLKTLKALVDHTPNTRLMLPEDLLKLALEKLHQHAKPGCLIRILSDFRGLGTAEEQALSRLGRRANLELLLIQDPLEASIPLGRHRFSNGQSELEIDVDHPFQTDYHSRFKARQSHLEQLGRKLNARTHFLMTNDPITRAEGKILR